MRIPASCSAGKLRSNAGCVSSSETITADFKAGVCVCVHMCEHTGVHAHMLIHRHIK